MISCAMIVNLSELEFLSTRTINHNLLDHYLTHNRTITFILALIFQAKQQSVARIIVIVTIKSLGSYKNVWIHTSLLDSTHKYYKHL